MRHCGIGLHAIHVLSLVILLVGINGNGVIENSRPSRLTTSRPGYSVYLGEDQGTRLSEGFDLVKMLTSNHPGAHPVASLIIQGSTELPSRRRINFTSSLRCIGCYERGSSTSAHLAIERLFARNSPPEVKVEINNNKNTMIRRKISEERKRKAHELSLKINELMKTNPTSLTLDQLSLNYDDSSEVIGRSAADDVFSSRDSNGEDGEEAITGVTDSSDNEDEDSEEEGAGTKREVEEELLEHGGGEEGGYSIRRTTYNMDLINRRIRNKVNGSNNRRNNSYRRRSNSRRRSYRGRQGHRNNNRTTGSRSHKSGPMYRRNNNYRHRL